jgi:hypothetical protein
MLLAGSAIYVTSGWLAGCRCRWLARAIHENILPAMFAMAHGMAGMA